MYPTFPTLTVLSLSFGDFFFFLCLQEHLIFLLGCTETMTVHSDFLNSNILILVLFHEQTKFQNILRNCLKYCGEIENVFLFPSNQNEKFQHFYVDIFHFPALK